MIRHIFIATFIQAAAALIGPPLLAQAIFGFQADK